MSPFSVGRCLAITRPPGNHPPGRPQGCCSNKFLTAFLVVPATTYYMPRTSSHWYPSLSHTTEVQSHGLVSSFSTCTQTVLDMYANSSALELVRGLACGLHRGSKNVLECDTGNLPGLSKQISTEQSIPELELKLNHIQRLQGTNASSCSSSVRLNCVVHHAAGNAGLPRHLYARQHCSHDEN